ncbi:ABC transporter substrate-binding protein [Lederbergia citrea]|uniref:Sugar ABC transporter substrate-binding protein n=1 Tax=Lederbergia citrea TaxID=2833581 RepID=A0A942UJT1_9BACI|nr:sugar ABC transporter substrate-binding protein [Lederbergia citrea]MBS4202589.1 sugar ABC transporter substrate-binding protein [Lederbergia citrea]MBS4222745.1 sugar ABC transporter substrate-binding protein [Lederbergia citrea]
MKKFSILLLILTLLLAACSGKSANKEEAIQTDDPDNMSGTITVWGWDVAAETMKLAVDGFQKEYPKVKVEVEDFNSDDLYEKLTVGLAARGAGLPDVVLMEEERIPGYLNQFPEGFVNLSKSGYDEHDDLFSDFKKKAVKNSDGDFIAAPWDIGPAAVFYRTDLFKEAGVDPNAINTWNDYIEAGKKIKAATGAKMLPIDIANYDGVFHMMLQQQGTSYFDESGNINLNSEEAIRAMSTIKELYDQDLVANNDGWNGIVTATINGSVATVPYGIWYTGTIMDQAPDQSGKWGIFYLPEFKEGGTRFANVGGSSLVIPASSKNKSAAYAFVEYFTTNKEAQLAGFEKYGLFPSLKVTYEEPVFNEQSEYFNNEPIFKMIADTVEEVPAITVNEHFARASKIMSDAQSAILFEGKPVKETLEKAGKQLDNEINN